MNSRRNDWLLASLTPGLGPNGVLRLIRHFGSLSLALQADVTALRGVIGHKSALALHQRQGQAACQAALDWACQAGRFLLTLADADYPLPLANSDAPPPLLFGLGRRELLSQPMLAMVGSRRSTARALATTRRLATGLAGHGFTIISGLASGIDSAAHAGALEHPAASIAVIGTGIDRVYPASTRRLAQQLASEGLILSEFPLGSPPIAHHFPRRNRIIAGLCRACLVIEAGIQSGSLITARLAAEAGREVMAMPGSVHDPLARGCHHLIKQGASLIETLEDVLNELDMPLANAPAAPQPTPAGVPLQWPLPGHEAFTIDELSTTLGLTAKQLYAILLQLELEGRVALLPGGRFQSLDS